MVASIPASEIVNVIPGVVGAGGSALDMVGLILTNNIRAPYGTVLRFSSLADVQTYFGVSSDEAVKAATYFSGYVNSFIKPASVLFAAYATVARSGWLRGATLSLSLTQLQALTGTLTITTAGVPLASASINLSGATSFSNAATIIQAAFTSPPFTVTYDSIAGAFLFTSNATGPSATMAYATGSLATALGLTLATGAVLSQGAALDDPATAMSAIVAATQNFVSFTTLFAMTDDMFVAFATWNGTQEDRYLFVGWTNAAAAITNSDTSSPARRIAALSLSGTASVYSPSADKAVFILGYVASLDFPRLNGRATAAFRSGEGLAADVTNATIADNLLENGYSFYGSYATANDDFIWLYNGSVSGDFGWIDSYIDQIWMNNAFQLSLMSLLAQVGQIPYNDDGYETIQTGIQSDIDAALNFGAIRAGVTLTEAQRSYVNSIAGIDITDVLFSRGWYLSVRDPGGTVRAARGSPVCTFFYTDGQSVQKITLSSLMVQ